MEMSKRELRSFRKAARAAARRARREGQITRLERGKFLLKLLSADACEEMADMCVAQAVECKVLTAAQATEGGHDWVAVGEGMDWEKFLEFFMMILPLLLV